MKANEATPTSACSHKPLFISRMVTAEEVMSPKVISVGPGTSLSTAAEMMLDAGVSGLPVVDPRGRLIGMVSKTDLVRDRVNDGAEWVQAEHLPSGVHEINMRSVGDVMTGHVLTISTTASVAEAARLLTKASIHRLGVVSAEGQLVGLLSTSDIVRWVAGLV